MGRSGSTRTRRGTATKQGQVNVYLDGNTSNPIAKNLGTSTSTQFFDSNLDITNPALTPGPHTLTVVTTTAATAPVQLDYVTVTASPASSNFTSTATALSVPAGTYTVASNLALTATVSPAVAGTVNFYDGYNLLGSATSSATTGVATLTTGGLTAGSHILKAIFAGTTTYAESSGTSTVAIGALTPAISLATTGNVNATMSVPLTATIASSNAGPVPQGTVTFYDGQTVLGTGAFAYRRIGGWVRGELCGCESKRWRP